MQRAPSPLGVVQGAREHAFKNLPDGLKLVPTYLASSWRMVAMLEDVWPEAELRARVEEQELEEEAPRLPLRLEG